MCERKNRGAKKKWWLEMNWGNGKKNKKKMSGENIEEKQSANWEKIREGKK